MEYDGLKKIEHISFGVIGTKDEKFYTGEELINVKLEEGWKLLKISDNKYIIGWFKEEEPKEDDYEKPDYSIFDR